MAFVDTQPVPIARGDPARQWARFRVRQPRQVLDTLRDICRSDTPVVVGVPGGRTLQAALWSVDDVQQRLRFRVDHPTELLNELSYEPDLWAAAYVESAKVQFDLAQVGLLLDGGGPPVLVSSFPERLYHLPRRQGVRVRRNDVDGPKARLVHPLVPGATLTLKLLDVSASGCALLNPAGATGLPPGLVLRQVEIELDDHTILFCDLQVQHVTVNSGREPSTRVGCEWRGMPAAAQERLLGWIASGSRRRHLMSLNFG